MIFVKDTEKEREEGYQRMQRWALDDFRRAFSKMRKKDRTFDNLKTHLQRVYQRGCQEGSDRMWLTQQRLLDAERAKRK